MLKVMIAEDDLMMADMLSDVLTASGYEVCGRLVLSTRRSK
jgi:DNA-binding response OmpR family regulator